MSKIAGVDVLLKVKSGADYVVVGGQTGASLSRDASVLDVTDKTSGGWAENLAGILSWGIEADGFVVLGDAGIELLETAFTNREAVEVEIRIGADAEATGVTYSGKGILASLPLEMPQDDAVTYSVSVTGSGPLGRVKGAVVA